ncbi:hypothetical protein E1180_11010 [Roseibium denhamense]|uniref:DUF4251 domain-containing protein n=1 Tax=Roseibium denhamense TaxID=76305 RepID=A0ABY1N7B5_9HYPH|nr:hypothetical protein [Roseibium denhamense]MTI06042.1 hypothetical protein [Roseibium denhamense]SMP01773.1 hypothetical protein SAMN06265374_0394 [Roseibium denhamense]
MLKWVSIAAIFIFAGTSAAVAGALQDKASQAETALSEGNASKAITLMREALVDVWAQAPMSVQTAIFVAAPADGFGIYTAKDGTVFNGGEPILVYLEPVGFLWKRQGDLYTSLLTVDFDLTSPDGKVLAGQKGFGRFDFKSRVPNTEYMANLTLNVSGAPAGDYVLVLTVNDENGGESVKVEMPFSIQ